MTITSTNEQMLVLIRSFLNQANIERQKSRIHIRTRDRCECGERFVDTRHFFVCPRCLENNVASTPQRHHVELYWRGKTRNIYLNSKGERLDSYEKALETAREIKERLHDDEFNPRDYKAKTCEEFRFDKCIEKWLDAKKTDLKLNKIANSTYSTAERFVRLYYEPHFQNKDIRSIKGQDIEDFRSFLVSRVPPLSINTQQGILKYLKSFFKNCVQKEIIKRVPFFPPIVGERKEVPIFDEQTLNKIFGFIPRQHKPLFSLLFFMGLRPGEARALRFKNIDWQKQIIKVCETFSERTHRKRTKTGYERFLPMHPVVWNYLLEIKKQRNEVDEEDFVFITVKNRPYSPECMREVWKKALQYANIPHRKLYTTRHSFASSAIRKADICSVRDFLGHVDLKTTSIYLHTGNIENLRTCFGLTESEKPPSSKEKIPVSDISNKDTLPPEDNTVKDLVPPIRVFPDDNLNVVLRIIRHQKNVTQKELARRLGTTQAVVSAMERGWKSITKKMAKRLAKALDVDHEVFLSK